MVLTSRVWNFCVEIKNFTPDLASADMFLEALKQVWNMRARNNSANQKNHVFQEPPQRPETLGPPAHAPVGPIDLEDNATKPRVWYGGVVKIYRIAK